MDAEIHNLTKTLIQTKILEAFKEQPEYIDSLVQAALQQEVNQYGGKPDFRDKTMPFLTYLVRDQIHRLARESIQEVVAEEQPRLKESIREQLVNGALSDGLLAAVVDAVKQEWRLTVNVQAEKEEDR